MADCLFEVIDRGELSPLAGSLMHSEPLSDLTTVNTLIFSGGVSEFLYKRTSKDFGDLGADLGQAITERLLRRGKEYTVVPGTEGIRATVIGAAQYTVQVSGSTIFCPDPDVLPLRNVPVLRVRLPDQLSTAGVEEAVIRASIMHDSESLDGPLALAISWPFGPAYHHLRALAEGLVKALGKRTEPVVLAFDKDIAGMVGRLLRDELDVSWRLVTVDEVELSELDYIDVGQPLPPTGVVPLVVKSLLFRPQQGLIA
jgi:ethanolamine utilization protein EutA